MIFNQMLEFVDNRWVNLLESLSQQWLSSQNLSKFAQAIHAKGATLDNVWGWNRINI